MTYVIKVTREDIDTGVQEDSASCPIAKAARRAFPKDTLVDVEERQMLVSRRGKTKKYPLPWEATDFIWQFDLSNPDGDRSEFTPFEFEVG